MTPWVRLWVVYRGPFMGQAYNKKERREESKRGNRAGKT